MEEVDWYIRHSTSARWTSSRFRFAIGYNFCPKSKSASWVTPPFRSSYIWRRVSIWPRFQQFLFVFDDNRRPETLVKSVELVSLRNLIKGVGRKRRDVALEDALLHQIVHQFVDRLLEQLIVRVTKFGVHLGISGEQPPTEWPKSLTRCAEFCFSLSLTLLNFWCVDLSFKVLEIEFFSSISIFSSNWIKLCKISISLTKSISFGRCRAILWISRS